MAKKIIARIDALSETITLIAALGAVVISGKIDAASKVWGSTKKINKYIAGFKNTGLEGELAEVVEVVQKKLAHEGVVEDDIVLVRQMVAHSLPSPKQIVDQNLDPGNLAKRMRERAIESMSFHEFQQTRIESLFNLIVEASLKKLFETKDFQDEMIWHISLSTQQKTKETNEIIKRVESDTKKTWAQMQTNQLEYEKLKMLWAQIFGRLGFEGDTNDLDAVKQYVFLNTDQHSASLTKIRPPKTEDDGKYRLVIEAVTSELEVGEVKNAKQILDEKIQNSEADSIAEITKKEPLYRMKAFIQFKEGDWNLAQKTMTKLIEMFKPISIEQAWLRSAELGIVLCYFGKFGGKRALNAGIKLLEQTALSRHKLSQKRMNLVIASSRVHEELGAAYLTKAKLETTDAKKRKNLRLSWSNLIGAGLLWNEESHTSEWARVELKKLQNIYCQLELVKKKDMTKKVVEFAEQFARLEKYDQTQLGYDTYIEYLEKSSLILIKFGSFGLKYGVSSEQLQLGFDLALERQSEVISIYADQENLTEMYGAVCQFTGTAIIVANFIAKKAARELLDACLIALMEGIDELNESEGVVIGKSYCMASMVHAHLYRDHGLKRSRHKAQKFYESGEAHLIAAKRPDTSQMINQTKNLINELVD